MIYAITLKYNFKNIIHYKDFRLVDWSNSNYNFNYNYNYYYYNYNYYYCCQI